MADGALAGSVKTARDLLILGHHADAVRRMFVPYGRAEQPEDQMPVCWMAVFPPLSTGESATIDGPTESPIDDELDVASPLGDD